MTLAIWLGASNLYTEIRGLHLRVVHQLLAGAEENKCPIFNDVAAVDAESAGEAWRTVP